MLDSLQNLSPKFTEKNLNCCDVEFASFGKDIVYHFWPTRGTEEFPQGFAKKLEDAFKLVLPQTADVRAEYINQHKAAAFMRFNDDPKQDATPVPTYYVRVVGWADNPMSELFLKDKVFRHLETFYGEA